MENFIRKTIKGLYKELFREYSLRRIRDKDVYYLDIAINKNNVSISIINFNSYEELDDGLVSLYDIDKKEVIIRRLKDDRKLSSLPTPFSVDKKEDEFLLFLTNTSKLLYNKTKIFNGVFAIKSFKFDDKYQHNKMIIKKCDLHEYLVELLHTYGYELPTILQVIELIK